MWVYLNRLKGGMIPVAVALTLAGALLLSLSTSAQAARTPAKTSTCSIATVGEKLGPSYVEKLKVVNVTCNAGDSLVKAYNACRLKHGGIKGKCTVKVDGYKCAEKRYSGSPDQFIAVATCTKSRDAVDFTYTQNT